MGSLNTSKSLTTGLLNSIWEYLYDNLTGQSKQFGMFYTFHEENLLYELFQHGYQSSAQYMRVFSSKYLNTYFIGELIPS